MRTSLEKKVRDDRIKFVKHPTKILIENINRKKNVNDFKKYICVDKRISEDGEEIRNDINNYYIELIGKEKISEEVIQNYDFKMKKMNDIVKEIVPSLDEKISCEETYKVIMEMSDSSPGRIGLTINFFKKCFPFFGKDFVKILNDDCEVLPETFNQSIIKLIPIKK